MKVKWLLKRIGTAIYNNRSNIEFVAGAAFVVVGTGMVIAKAEEAVEVKHEIERQKKNIELTDNADGWESSSERTKACFGVARTAICGYSKVYWKSLGMEAVGFVLMGVSHATDRNEIASKTVALSSLAAQFAAYRQNVIDDLGEAKDEEYFIGKPKTTVTVNEDGTTTVEDNGIDIPDHAFLFDETNENYEKEGYMNRDFLENHERWLNDRLWSEGILWENDIRRDVKAPIDPTASKGDWGITAVDDDGNRNYISFGIGKNTERAQAFRDGVEKSFLVILSNMEPNISTKLYRLSKYHKDVKLA